MFQRIVNFIKYNNATAIIVSMVFGGVGVSLAATPQVQSAVYSSSQVSSSVDNTLIRLVDLENFDFNLKITSVTEDSDNYYVGYSYRTISVVDSVWKNVNEKKTLTVNKISLGERDLGLYVADELADNMNYERSYLKRVQEIEKGKGASKKIITTEYSGLVGKLLDPKDKVIEGYDPLIPEVVPEEKIVSEPPQAPDPALFVENQPGYVKPVEVAPKPQVPQAQIDQQAIRAMVQQMMAQYPTTVVVPTTPTPTPEAAPKETVPVEEKDPLPEIDPTTEEKDKEPAPTPATETTPDPQPVKEETSSEVTTEEKTLTPEVKSVPEKAPATTTTPTPTSEPKPATTAGSSSS